MERIEVIWTLFKILKFQYDEMPLVFKILI